MNADLDRTDSVNSTERLTRSPATFTVTSGSDADLELEVLANVMSDENVIDDQSSLSGTVYLQCSWPILYASLIASVVDAVRSWWPLVISRSTDEDKDRRTNNHTNNSKSHHQSVPDSTPESELCVAALENLIGLIQVRFLFVFTRDNAADYGIFNIWLIYFANIISSSSATRTLF